MAIHSVVSLRNFQAWIKTRQLEQLAWAEFPKSILLLLSNRYVFQGFWDFHNGRISQAAWEDQFQSAKVAAQTALGKQDTPTVLWG